MDDHLLETWQIHNRIMLYLLAGIPAEALLDAFPAKGRTVAAQFAHIHNVRLMWLKAAAPQLLEMVSKIGDKEPCGFELLSASLEASGTAIEALLRQGLTAGRIKAFKPHPTAFAGYLIAHESYHSGKIDMTLRQCGHPLDDKVHYGLWEWGVR